MNILADFHHADLWWSLQLLADRLGATLYRPYGMDWYDEGYLKLYGNLRAKNPDRWIAKQYLEDTIFDVSYHLPTLGWRGIGREAYNGCTDYPHFNLLPFDEAPLVGIDIIICSVHENEPYFAKLKEFYPNAKFVRQVGNDLDTLVDETLYPNLLSSATMPFEAFKGPNKVLYRQEFDLNLFKPGESATFKNIYSFQNDLEQFVDTWDFWVMLKHQLRDYKFKSYGVGNDNGKIYPKKDYIKAMQEATFLVQSKGPWEGYGHTIHNAICMGKPMIIKMDDYKGKLAECLLIKDETYLEMTDPEIVEKIRHFSEPERYKKMADKCVEVFNQNVSFDKEFEERIKPFFENLV